MVVVVDVSDIDKISSLILTSLFLHSRRSQMTGAGTFDGKGGAYSGRRRSSVCTCSH